MMRLEIGSQLPDFAIAKLITPLDGVVSVPIQTSAFQDRLMNIDFWATNCSGCVAALPKMEELQQKFGDKVKILPVTYEDKALVMNFWKTNKYTRQLALPTVVEDQQFEKYFPHEAVPHEVWIYKGKVIGITEAEYVDSHNIQQVLNRKIPNWPLKNDYYAFNGNKEQLFTPNEKQVDVATTKLNYAA